MTADEIENMKKIVESIQSMDKFDQMEILKILVNNSCKINENKSGVFVNLTLLPQNVLDEMREYIRYIKFKQDSIDTFETKKLNTKILSLFKQIKTSLQIKYILHLESNKTCVIHY